MKHFKWPAKRRVYIRNDNTLFTSDSRIKLNERVLITLNGLIFIEESDRLRLEKLPGESIPFCGDSMGKDLIIFKLADWQGSKEKAGDLSILVK